MRSGNFLRENNARWQWHPNAHPRQSEEQPPRIIVGGDGYHITDIDGRRVVDGVAGLWNVNAGYGQPEIIAAITEQLQRLAYYSSFKGTATPPSIELSKRLVEMMAPEDMARAYFSSGGSDAIETALKIARQYWKLTGERDRFKFISLRQGYHGTHFGGASINGSAIFRRAYEPLLQGCLQIDTPWTYRNPYTEDPEALGRICAELLDREIQFQGSDTVAAFIAEPIQGAGGVIVPPANFWPLARQVCDKHGVLFIADEIVTGFGRAGEMFGSRLWGVQPDMMCLAKGITSGYFPLGATMINRRIADAFSADRGSFGRVSHAYTYSGHPAGCAAALAALDLVERDDYPGRARALGQRLMAGLQPLVGRFANIGEVRGRGLMVALDIVADKQTRAPLGRGSDLLDRLADAAFRHGAMVRPAGGNIILSPPLIIDEAGIDTIVSALEAAFCEVSG
jgi:adenosylmethionine-8-amino-7-oxononanoate aminotransferase